MNTEKAVDLADSQATSRAGATGGESAMPPVGASRCQEKSVFCVEHAGYCYVQDASGGFLGGDGRWTDNIAEAWTTGDRVHAETVARQQNEKRERDAGVVR